ncbi:hypothetical protein RND81_10G055500 [Saponaria officinalis]|uniref:Myb/SANT-like DNA-binding domain-containing protein n=1 Tax=Saponaria officinalis TaxID=3572 RepID=A0AAW1I0R7_SAPOF
MGRESTTQDDQSPQKQPTSGAGAGGDRLKRDEWSEGAVSILLEAYESKWILRNRAKLKGQDWEDVAKCVSSRASNSKSHKTLTQCKNKIESMKKRYRSESAGSDLSSWPLFSRLDHLLRGTSTGSGTPPQASVPAAVVESSPVTLPPLQPAPLVVAQNHSQESTDVDPMVKENDGIMTAKSNDDQVTDKNNNDEHHRLETDSSTPALYSNDKQKTTMKRKRRRRGGSNGWEEVAESIRWLADAVVRTEQARMETMKEVERMRVEAEAKRGEMDVKRTEIVANTQLEIARLFASVAGKNVDSSLRIGRSDL